MLTPKAAPYGSRKSPLTSGLIVTPLPIAQAIMIARVGRSIRQLKLVTFYHARFARMSSNEDFEMTKVNLNDEVDWPGKGRMSLGTVFCKLHGDFGPNCKIAITLMA